MRGPSFEELAQRAIRFRSTYGLGTPREAVNLWHDCVGHCLFHEFTPPTLEGEMLAGRHQHLVMGGTPAEVLAAAPAKFEIHLRTVMRDQDPESVARKDRLLDDLPRYLARLTLYENLREYDDPLYDYLKRNKPAPWQR